MRIGVSGAADRGSEQPGSDDWPGTYGSAGLCVASVHVPRRIAPAWRMWSARAAIDTIPPAQRHMSP